MKNNFVKIIMTGLVAGSMLASPVFAQDEPGHPRVNEVNKRIENQENRTAQGVEHGKINPRQAHRDAKRDARIARQERRDEAKHHGHLTKREDRHLNKELNRNSRDIHNQRHE